jgi:hypothetical protein
MVVTQYRQTDSKCINDSLISYTRSETMTDQEQGTVLPSEIVQAPVSIQQKPILPIQRAEMPSIVVETTSEEDVQPWEHPDAIRRDIEPHRGDLLLLIGTASLILSLLGATAPLALLLGGYAWKMGVADRQKIRTGELDPEGQRSAEMGQALGICGVIVSLIVCFWVVVLISLQFVL